MPVKYETDPVTGKVTEVYEFGPQKPAVKPKREPSLLEKAGKGIADARSIAETFNPTAMVGQGLKAGAAGLQTLQKTGDVGKAFGAATKATVDESNKGTGIAGAIKRVPQRALLTTLQETSDFAQEVGAKVTGRKSPTSAKTPDAPFLGVLPALPRARSSGPAEDLAVGAVQLGLGFATGSAAAGLGGMAIKGAFNALPLAARLGVATTRLRAAKDFAQAAAPVVQAGAKISGAVQAGVKAAGPVGQVAQAGAQAVAKSGLSQVTGKAAITSAITDVVAFDQYTGRLTDAANDLVKGTPFEPLVIDYLKSDPNDGALEGRFKNALEGLLVGGALEVPFRFFKQVKAAANYRKAVEGKTELDKLTNPKVLEAIDDVKNANDSFQNEIVKQTETREADPGEQPSFADELDRPIARNVAEVRPATLAVDPQRFQYKIAGAKTKTGVSGSLKEAKEYDPQLAGLISVWKDPENGYDFVVNGHNRVQKALESGTEKVLVRYIQAPDAASARAVGALQNIAEGQGDALDAAKFMRDMKIGPEALGNYNVNLTGKIASRAIPLSRLPQNVFDKVATGALTEDRAIALGSVADLDETVINSVAARAEKGKWSADKITQAMQEAKFATASTPAAGGGMLPGFEDFFATSNFDQLLDVRTEAAKALREGVTALSSAAIEGRQGVLEAAGNVIDVAGSQAAKATAQQAVNLFDRVTQYEGPVRALLNDLAAQVTPKKKAAAIVRENFEKIRAAIDDEANGPRLPFEEPAPEAPRPQPVPVEPEPTAPETAPAAPSAAEEIVDNVIAAVAAPKTKGAKSKEKPFFPTDEVRLAAAEKAGNTSLAEQLRARIAKTAVQPMGNVAAAAIEPPTTGFALPAELTKSAPRYNYGSKAFQLQFASDYDKTAYILAGDAVKASKAAPKFRNALEQAGLDVASAVAYGQKVRDAIKALAKNSQPGVINLPDQSDSFPTLRSRGPELPELPKKPLTREEIETRIEEIDKLIADIESDKFNMQVDEPRTRALVEELTKDIRTVAGGEVAIRFNNAFMETSGDVAWGYKPGETMKVGGEYDPITDIIEVNNVELLSGDVQRPELLQDLVDKLEQSAFHEAFHRVQFNFLKPEEIRVFNQFLAGFKLDIGSMADRTANARAGRADLMPIEKAAVSFQTYAWARKNNLDPVQALLGSTRAELEASSGLQTAAFAVMDTLYDFIERVGNAFQGRGFISIKSIFEDAYSGKLAKRGELGSVVDDAGKAVPSELDRLDLLQAQAMEYERTRRGSLDLPPLRSSADRFVDEYENNKAKIASGEITLEDLITNVVADRNVQPMQSPSGETAYVPDPETAAGASTAMRAWMDVGGTREEASGLPVLPDDIVRQEAERWLATHDYQANAVLAELEYRSSGLANAAQLQRALLLGHQLADYTNNKAAIIADQWLNSKYDPNADRDAIRQELLAIYKHASDINTPVVKATRALGQLLRTPQIQRPQPGSIDFKNTIEEYKIDEILVNGAKEEEAVPLPEYLSDKIDPAFNDALENNEFSPELDAMIDQIAYNLKATRDTPSFGPSYWSQINKASKIGLNGLVMYRSAQLLSSGLTFWGNTLNGVFRLIQMPLAQIVGAGMQLQFERAGYSAQIYGQYVRNLSNAFALAKESYKAGRTLYDLDNQSLDFLDQQVNKDQGELIPLTGPVVLPTTDKGFTVSTMPWIDIQDKSTWALAQKRLWQTATSPIRAQIAVDTLFKVLAGQSFEFVRNLPMGMDNAVAQGLERNSKEAMDYAQQYADAAVKQATRHATVEGRTILDAIMTSPHAQTAMRYATFTDDIDAQMEVRTFDRGMEIAKDKKLEGKQAEAWAREWADKKQDIPFFTKAPSAIPMVWQKLIDLHPAFSILQPFNRTPADIIKSAIRMTPAAFFVDTAYRDLNSMDAMTRDRVIGDVAVGSTAIGLAMVGLSAGIVEMTGGGPQEPAAKQKWRDSGKQPYSIRFGDTPWISYRVSEPFATVFGAVADYFEIQGNLTKEQRENLGDALTMTVLGMVASGTLGKSYYQGFTEFYEAVAGNASLDIKPNSRSSWSRYLSRIVASLEPASSALRAGRRLDDRVVRTVEPGSFFQEVFDEIRNQTPGWSYGIPARVNWLTGDPIVQSGILGDAHLPPDNPWMAMAMQYVPWSPLQRGEEKSSIDPVAAEMASLHSKGANFRGPHAADYGGQLRLDPSEFADYSRTMATVTDPNFNTTVYQELDALIKSEFYQAQPITEPSSESLSGRAQLIDGVISKYKRLAQEVYLQTRPDLQLALLKKQTADNDVNYQLKYGLNPLQFQQEALR